MSDSVSRRVASQTQFGRQARLYTVSPGHRSGESLQVLQEWAARGHYRMAADVATGTGFTAFAMSPHAGHVLATDITPGMLEEARQGGRQRGLPNLGYALAAAEDLPFAGNSLDLLTCRIAAHHFHDIPRAVDEWRRALKPGGILLFVDTVCPEDEAVARWMNDVEGRRDPSHVTNMSPSQWVALFEAEGFGVTDTALCAVPQDFDTWTERSGTPPDEVERLRRDFLHAPPGAVEAFRITAGGDGNPRFQWTALALRAVRAR